MPVFWTIEDWTHAIAALPVDGPLPCRTILVPRERVAHGIRRDLVKNGHPEALAGTRFKPTRDAAKDVLRQAGIAFIDGEESLRPARLLALFHEGLSLEYFDLDHLRTRPGWDEAFARTINDLEAQGLTPGDLDPATPQSRDVATVWRAAEASAGTSWTEQRIYREAAARLQADRRLWPYPGPTLATAFTTVTEAEATFLHAIPDAQITLLAARPIRDAYVQRVNALLGPDIAKSLEAGPPVPDLATEKDVLSAYLFTVPEILLADRPPRPAPQHEERNEVAIEEHAGVEDEVEASAQWVGEQILENIPLDEIAVLVPSLDPLASLVSQRLQRLPTPLPVYVAGGLPLVETASGARTLAVVRALRANLSAESMAGILPYLKTTDETRSHLSLKQSRNLAWSLGILGGSPAHPGGALDWTKRFRERQVEIAKWLVSPPQGVEDREVQHRRHQLQDVRALQSAVEALTNIAAAVLDSRALDEIWPLLSAFLNSHLRQPPPPAHALISETMQRLATGTATRSLAGDDALRLIEDVVKNARTASARFGEPAVYVGTVTEAVGLRFQAVRVIGLAEGHFAAAPSQDPVLPSRQGPDRVLQELHALDSCLRNAGPRVALSAPRVDVMRSERHPSFVLLEAAMALGRTKGLIPDAVALARDYFTPAREDRAKKNLSSPLDDAAWLDGVARHHFSVPKSWLENPAVHLDNVRALPATHGGLDGLVDATGASIPGTREDLAISPSSLGRLLGCPHRYLLESLLKLGEPDAPPKTGEVQQPDFGTLVHTVAATFYEKHGNEFLAHQRTLDEWKAIARDLAHRHFEEFLEEYPLAGGEIREQQKRWLQRDVETLLELDWRAGGSRRILGIEKDFGPLEVQVGERRLFLKGRIDRIEEDGDAVVVRDLKTGSAHPRIKDEAGPTMAVDLQIGVYGMGALDLFPGHARAEGAYVYLRGHGSERAFRGDFGTQLRPALDAWLEVAAGLLHDGVFPRTTDSRDCQYCHFKPVCGDHFEDRACDVVRSDGRLKAFAALRGDGQDETEGTR